MPITAFTYEPGAVGGERSAQPTRRYLVPPPVADILNENGKPTSETGRERYNGDGQRGDDKRVEQDDARTGDGLADLGLHTRIVQRPDACAYWV